MQSQPEYACRPECGHSGRLCGQLRDDYVRGKRREGFDRVKVGASGTLAPKRYRPRVGSKLFLGARNPLVVTGDTMYAIRSVGLAVPYRRGT